jgi:hypothetical protein
MLIMVGDELLEVITYRHFAYSVHPTSLLPAMVEVKSHERWIIEARMHCRELRVGGYRDSIPIINVAL